MSTRKPDSSRRHDESGALGIVETHPELLEHANSIILHWTRDGRITYMNAFGLRFFGFSEEEILNRHVVGTIVPETEKTGRDLRPLMEQICADPIAFEQNVNENIRRNGERVWIAWTNKVYFNNQGEIDGILSIGNDITERKRIEIELRRMNRTLQTLSECNRILVHATDETGLLEAICRVIIDTGGYRLAWIGYKECDEEKTVRPMAQAGYEEGYLETLKITWGDSERGRGPTGTAIRTGLPISARHILTDSHFAPWRAEAIKRGYASSLVLPLTNASGDVFGALNIYAPEPDAFDTSEIALLSEVANGLAFGIIGQRTRVAQTQAEKEQQKTTQILEYIIEFLPDATFVIDQDKRVIAWNLALENLTGVKKPEILGQGDYAYALPFYGKRQPILIDLLDVPSAEMESNYTYIRRTSETIFAEAFLPKLNEGKGAYLKGGARILYDQEGRRCGAVETMRDVTEEKRVEQALHESERKHRTLFETASDGILLIRDTHCIDCNAQTLALFGCTREQIIGATLLDFSPPVQPDGRPSQKSVAEHIRQALSGNAVRFEWEHCRWDRTPFISEVSLNRLTLGRENLLQAVVRDVTARKRIEEDLRKLNLELEQRVFERTADLAKAKERAESADRLKSAFLASMSHELRTPLNSIIGFTGIVLQGLAGPLNEEQNKQLGMVQSSARHLLDLINDVLDLSKIEAGQLEIESKPFDVGTSIEKVVRLVTPMAEKKGLVLTHSMSSDIQSLTSDRRRFEQILINLINNAIKFSDEGQVCVECTVADQNLVTHVKDTGMGIKPEDLGKLFRTFQQVDAGLSRNFEGTGLGLSICKKLVELLGGEISVRSIWGVGSTFTFRLPYR